MNPLTSAPLVVAQAADILDAPAPLEHAPATNFPWLLVGAAVVLACALAAIYWMWRTREWNLRTAFDGIRRLFRIGRDTDDEDDDANPADEAALNAGHGSNGNGNGSNGYHPPEGASDEALADLRGLFGRVKEREAQAYALSHRLFDHSRVGLAHRIDRFLTQDRSAEALRQLCEDEVFLAVDGAGVVQEMHLRAFTSRQLELLSNEVRVEIASERLRRYGDTPRQRVDTNATVSVHEKRGRGGRPPGRPNAPPPLPEELGDAPRESDK